MKIAINTLGPSKIKAGIGNYVVNLVKELSKIDKSNNYLIIANKDNADFFDLNNKNFETFIAPKYTTIKLLRLLWEQLKLPFILKKNNVDLLHSPGFVAPLIKTTKSVVTIHDMTFFSHAKYHTIFKQIYFGKMIPLSARNTDAIIADSNNTKEEIGKYLDIPGNKITTVYLGAGKEFKPIRKTTAQKILLDKYGIHHKFVLFVGMIEPRKNLARLVEAFKNAKDRNTKLVIVGKKGWHTKELSNTIKKVELQNDVIFTGYVPDEDLIMFYNATEFFIYPSLYEGFGIPVIEAMACGCPVITSNISSMKEISGDSAILVEPQNVENITTAIKKLLKNKSLRKELSKSGIERAKFFTWKITAEKTLDVYNKVLDNATQQNY